MYKIIVFFLWIVPFLSFSSINKSLYDNLKNNSNSDSVRISSGIQLSINYCKKREFDSSFYIINEMRDLKLNSNYKNANYLIDRNEMIVHWFKLDFDEVLLKLKQLVKEAKNLGNDEFVAECHLNLCKLYGNLYSFDLSNEYLDSAFNYYRGQKDQIQIAELYGQYGNISNSKSNLLEAIGYFVKALAIYDSINEPDKHATSIVYLLDRIGDIYAELPQPEKALEYYFETLKRYETNDQNIQMPYTYYNIAVVYKDQKGNTKKAKSYFLKAINSAIKFQNITSLTTSKISLSACYIQENKIDSALTHINEAFDLLDTNAIEERICVGYSNKGACYIKIGNIKKARKNLEISFEIAKKLDNNKILSNVYKNLAELTIVEGRNDEALEYFNTYVYLIDSVKNSKISREVAAVELNYQLEKNELEKKALEANELLNKEKIEQRTNLNYIFGFLILVLIIFIIQISRSQYKISSKAKVLTGKNKKIQNQKIKLEELYNTNRKLISGLSHDVATPFSSIMGLVYMLRETGKLNKKQNEVANLIEESANKGVSLAREIVNAQKNNTKFLAPVLNLERFDVGDLVRNVVSSFEPIANSKKILIHNDICKNVIINSDKSYFSRIADNLISNAIKFTPSNKNVFIYLNKTSNQLILTVRDEGLGFSVEDKENLFKSYQKLSAKPTAGESSTGLGLSIIKALVDKLEGKIYLKSEKNNGAEFRIEFPI